MTAITIHKMDGTGNDFVIADLRDKSLSFTKSQIKKLSKRSNIDTNGCDQFIILKNSDKADVFMEIYNSDGSKSGACGNATRCVAWIIMQEKDDSSALIESPVGILTSNKIGEEIEVNMGTPKTEWNEIPVSKECDTLNMEIEAEGLQNPVGVSMGNPHAVFFVENNKKMDLEKIAPQIQANKIFPEGVNVGVASVIDKSHISLRVYERGSGETASCGTGACAALVSAVRRGLTERSAEVILKGGNLNITWAADGNVWMRGPVKHHFEKNLSI